MGRFFKNAQKNKNKKDLKNNNKEGEANEVHSDEVDSKATEMLSMMDQVKQTVELEKQVESTLKVSEPITESWASESESLNVIPEKSGLNQHSHVFVVESLGEFSINKNTQMLLQWDLVSKLHFSETNRKIKIATLFDDLLIKFENQFKDDHPELDFSTVYLSAVSVETFPNMSSVPIGLGTYLGSPVILDPFSFNVAKDLIANFNLKLDILNPINAGDLSAHLEDIEVGSYEIVESIKQAYAKLVHSMPLTGLQFSSNSLDAASASECFGIGGVNVESKVGWTRKPSFLNLFGGVSEKDGKNRLVAIPLTNNHISFSIIPVPKLHNINTIKMSSVAGLEGNVVVGSDGALAAVVPSARKIISVEVPNIACGSKGQQHINFDELLNTMQKNSLMYDPGLLASLSKTEYYFPSELLFESNKGVITILRLERDLGYEYIMRVEINAQFMSDELDYSLKVQFINYHLGSFAGKLNFIPYSQELITLGVIVDKKVAPMLYGLTNGLASGSYYDGLVTRFTILVDKSSDLVNNDHFMDIFKVGIIDDLIQGLASRSIHSCDYSFASNLMFFLDSMFISVLQLSDFESKASLLHAGVCMFSDYWTSAENNADSINPTFTIKKEKTPVMAKKWPRVDSWCVEHEKSGSFNLCCKSCVNALCTTDAYNRSPDKYKYSAIFQLPDNVIFTFGKGKKYGRAECFTCKHYYVSDQLASLCRRFHLLSEGRSINISTTKHDIDKLDFEINQFLECSALDPKELKLTFNDLLDKCTVKGKGYQPAERGRIGVLRAKLTSQYNKKLPLIFNAVPSQVIDIGVEDHLKSNTEVINTEDIVEDKHTNTIDLADKPLDLAPDIHEVSESEDASDYNQTPSINVETQIIDQTISITVSGSNDYSTEFIIINGTKFKITPCI